MAINTIEFSLFPFYIAYKKETQNNNEGKKSQIMGKKLRMPVL